MTSDNQPWGSLAVNCGEIFHKPVVLVTVDAEVVFRADHGKVDRAEVEAAKQ